MTRLGLKNIHCMEILDTVFESLETEYDNDILRIADKFNEAIETLSTYTKTKVRSEEIFLILFYTEINSFLLKEDNKYELFKIKLKTPMMQFFNRNICDFFIYWESLQLLSRWDIVYLLEFPTLILPFLKDNDWKFIIQSVSEVINLYK